MKERMISAAIVAAGIVVLGLCIKGGIDNFVNKDRQVTVKGLSEKEVEADKVTWPISTNEMGNDLPDLYDKTSQTQQSIKTFLLKNGVKENEITMGAPSVTDLNANEWNENKRSYRYMVQSNLTVTSKNVKLVRSLINRQGEMLKEGIAFETSYNNQVTYEYTSFKDKKPEMMKEAIENAQKTAEQFAENSNSKLNKIISADQGQFSIEDRDGNTPWIKNIRVVTTITYSLQD